MPRTGGQHGVLSGGGQGISAGLALTPAVASVELSGRLRLGPPGTAWRVILDTPPGYLQLVQLPGLPLELEPDLLPGELGSEAVATTPMSRASALGPWTLATDARGRVLLPRVLRTHLAAVTPGSVLVVIESPAFPRSTGRLGPGGTRPPTATRRRGSPGGAPGGSPGESPGESPGGGTGGWPGEGVVAHLLAGPALRTMLGQALQSAAGGAPGRTHRLGHRRGLRWPR